MASIFSSRRSLPSFDSGDPRCSLYEVVRHLDGLVMGNLLACVGEPGEEPMPYSPSLVYRLEAGDQRDSCAINGSPSSSSTSLSFATWLRPCWANRAGRDHLQLRGGCAGIHAIPRTRGCFRFR
jgi:hypothetical protein